MLTGCGERLPSSSNDEEKSMRLLGIAFALVLAALTASVALAANPHIVTGFPEPGCTIAADGLTVNCVSTQIAGVGNNNAVATLTATYSGTVDCNNPGNNRNNPIESHETTFDVVASSGIVEPKNGRLVIPALSAGPRALTPEEEATLCPNPNWEAVLRDVELVGFTYTIDFVDADGNVVENFFTQIYPMPV
jgi:hypothetical protein